MKIMDIIIIYMFPLFMVVFFAMVVDIYLLLGKGTRLRADFDAYFLRNQKKCGFNIVLVTLLGNNGMQAIVLYRIGHFFYKKKIVLFADTIRRVMIFFTGIDISPSARIGKGFEIYHGHGLVIGKLIEIGKKVLVCQNVTIGYSADGRAVIGDNVKIFAGAKIIGHAIVGENCRIGANAVVTRDIPSNSTVACARSAVIAGVKDW